MLILLIYLVGVVTSELFVLCVYMGVVRSNFMDWKKFFNFSNILIILMCTLFSWVGLVGLYIHLSINKNLGYDVSVGLGLLREDLGL